MLKKIAGVLLLVIGLFFAVSSLKMIFVDTPKMKSALKDAVYVGQGAINDANEIEQSKESDKSECRNVD